jgi:hypothetical protein
MTDDQTLRVLEELRDLARDAAARHERAIALQEEAIANQRQAIDTQRRALSRIVPFVLIVMLVFLVPYLWNLIAYFVNR